MNTVFRIPYINEYNNKLLLFPQISRKVTFLCNQLIFRRNCCNFIIKIGCEPMQMKLLDIVNAYLSTSTFSLNWYPILFNDAIQHSASLSTYISSKQLNLANLPMEHKEMMLHYINSSARNRTVYSDKIEKLQIDGKSQEYMVSVHCSTMAGFKCQPLKYFILTGRRKMDTSKYGIANDWFWCSIRINQNQSQFQQGKHAQHPNRRVSTFSCIF